MIDASIVLEKLKLMMPLAQHTEPAAQLLCEQAAQALTGSWRIPPSQRMRALRSPRLRLPEAGW